MIVQEAIRSIATRLRDAGLEDPVMESEFLVAAALGLSRPHLVLRQQQAISYDAEQSLRRWTEDRAQRKPIAYVLGEQPFMNLTLSVNPMVLVPRPETELLVERALQILDHSPEPIRVIDVGTGSGNIALVLNQHPNIRSITGIDISPQALAVARNNAAKYDTPKRCRWEEGDLLSPFDSDRNSVDLVIANLPYVRTSEIDHLQPEVRWEPRLALDGGADGLQPIFRLCVQAKEVLRKGGILLLEIGYDQAVSIQEQLKQEGGWKDIQLFHDLAGHPRIIQTTKEGTTHGYINN